MARISPRIIRLQWIGISKSLRRMIRSASGKSAISMTKASVSPRMTRLLWYRTSWQLSKEIHPGNTT
ncbi:hypothetical protein BGZ97_005495, partial [Linnemannia gamsii]